MGDTNNQQNKNITQIMRALTDKRRNNNNNKNTIEIVTNELLV